MRGDFKWAVGVQPSWFPLSDQVSIINKACPNGIQMGPGAFFSSWETMRSLSQPSLNGSNINELSVLAALCHFLSQRNYLPLDRNDFWRGFSEMISSSGIEKLYLSSFLANKADLPDISQFKNFSLEYFLSFIEGSDPGSLLDFLASNLTFEIGCPSSRDKFIKRETETNLAENCSQFEAIPLRWKLQMTTQTPVWGAVFVTSNDIIEGNSELGNCLSHYTLTKKRLVTVVGGMKFLEILERYEFDKITFFDLNLNEVSKLTLAIDYILKTNFSSYDSMKCVNNVITSNPQHFYLSSWMEDVVHMVPTESYIWKYRGRKAALDTILPPDLFPEFVWNPLSESSYRRVQKQLAHAIDPNFYLGFANVTVPENSVVVYYATHVDADVTTLVQGTNTRIIPLFSSIDKKFEGRNVDIIGNAHSWWQHKVSSYLKGASLHVWSINDKNLLGSKRFEKPYFTAGDVVNQFVMRNYTHRLYGTVILHILLGKAKVKIMPCVSHVKMFLAAIKTACKLADRVIIADANKDSGVFISDEFECLPDHGQILKMATDVLKEEKFNISTIDYSCGDSRWGGETSYGIVSKRNIFIVADKVSME